MSELKIPLPGHANVTWNLHFFDTVDSTNRMASDLARQGLPEGQVILADHQDAGRGRLDRVWLDIPGSSVLMSILLRPKFPTEFFFLITSALSLAASQALSSKFSIESKLKWPNDVMVSGKKIAGVLAEVTFDERDGPWMVAGIGLNCKQTENELSHLGRPATSVFVESNVLLDLVDREDLAREIMVRFAQAYLPLGDPQARISLASQYRQACETVGSLVKVEMADETLIGVASDISVEGNLLVETESCMRAVPAGDVVHLRKG